MIKRFTKEELAAYTDENAFIEEVVIPLFETIADTCKFREYGPVKIEFWGRDKRMETYHGIDVYFGYHDHFYRPKHIGMQCKIDNIIAGSSASLTNSIETIRNQIKKAYDYEFTSPLDSQTHAVNINGFHLITSKTINPPARELYQGDKFVNLDFFDGDSLTYLIEKYTTQLGTQTR